MPPPACNKDHATVSFLLEPAGSWQVTRLLVYDGHAEDSIEPVPGTGHATYVPFSGLSRGVVIVQNLGAKSATFNWDIDASGSYQPPADPGPVQSIYLDPAPRMLSIGQTAAVAVRARFGTCEDGLDVSGEATPIRPSTRSPRSKAATCARSRRARRG